MRADHMVWSSFSEFLVLMPKPSCLTTYAFLAFFGGGVSDIVRLVGMFSRPAALLCHRAAQNIAQCGFHAAHPAARGRQKNETWNGPLHIYSCENKQPLKYCIKHLWFLIFFVNVKIIQNQTSDIWLLFLSLVTMWWKELEQVPMHTQIVSQSISMQSWKAISCIFTLFWMRHYFNYDVYVSCYQKIPFIFQFAHYRTYVWLWLLSTLCPTMSHMFYTRTKDVSSSTW